MSKVQTFLTHLWHFDLGMSLSEQVLNVLSKGQHRFVTGRQACRQILLLELTALGTLVRRSDHWSYLRWSKNQCHQLSLYLPIQGVLTWGHLCYRQRLGVQKWPNLTIVSSDKPNIGLHINFKWNCHVKS